MISVGPPSLAARVAREGLASGDEPLARAVARSLVLWAKLSGPQRAGLRDAARELAPQLEPLLDPQLRADLQALLASEGRSSSARHGRASGPRRARARGRAVPALSGQAGGGGGSRRRSSRTISSARSAIA